MREPPGDTGYGERVTGELAGRDFGEVYMTWPDDPVHGPRLRIAAAAARILVTVPLLALVDAGESPWAEIRGAGRPGEGDPHGYRGAVLSIDADGGPVTYRIGEYVPAARSYAAERTRSVVDLEVVGVVQELAAQFLVSRDGDLGVLESGVHAGLSRGLAHGEERTAVSLVVHEPADTGD